MPIFTSDFLLRVCADLFVAYGAPAADAQIAAEELVESSLLGFDSHGVMRAAQYVQDIVAGRIRPGSPIVLVKETPTTAVVDCGFNFGAVSARHMVEVVCAKARHGIACAVSLNSHHVGRLGAWVHRIADRDLIGLAFVNNTRGGHAVAPWGGREGRLGTNPIAWAAPVPGDAPLVMDMATCMMPEGKIRVHLHSGTPLPPGIILDASGRPSEDPRAFYGPPRGAILPLGAPHHGHKGFGLALLVELLGGVLAGYATREFHPHTNGLCLIAIDPEAFCGAETFKALVKDLVEYVVDTPPADGFREVVMPGVLDLRTRRRRQVEGIPLPDETWRQITAAGAQVGLRFEERSDRAG